MADQLDLLTSFVAASHARTSAPQDAARASPAHVPGCGSRCTESCARCGHFGSLLRTSLACELSALTGFTATWNKRATPGGSTWWVLTTSARPIDANACGESSGEWPTPTATPYGSSNNGSPGDGREAYATAGKPSLENMAREWVTPTASLAEAGNMSRSGDRKDELLLTGQVMAEWPTPMARDHMPAHSAEYIANQRAKGHGCSNLNDKVLTEWPTPTSTLGSNGARTTPRDATNGPNLHEAVAGMWPTPRAEDSEQAGAHRGAPDTLTSATRTWPTPLASDSRGSAGVDKNELPNAVRMWPTATAQDAEQSGSRNLPGSAAHPGTSLTDATAREWMTPSTRDYKDTPGMSTFTEERHAADQLPRQVFALAGQRPQDSHNTTGRPPGPHRMLNASWVFQLMGYPDTWARLSTRRGSKHPATPSCPTSPPPSGGSS